MNILFYSDLHITEERHCECELVLDTIGELAKKHKALIVNGGDTHPIRGLIKTASHDLLTQKYKRWYEDGLTQHILIGNHDQEDRDGNTHPMRAFEKWQGWHVIGSPKVIDGIAYLPYMPKERCKEAIKFAVKQKAQLAVVHWGIQGAKRNDFNVDTDGVPVEWLKHFKRVFSGHYHFRNAFENVQYIGSPFQHTHAEANQDKGVILYDVKKDKQTFIEIKGTPKHYTVSYKIDEDGPHIEGDIKSITKHDFVKVKVEGDAELVHRVSHDDLRKHFECAELKFDRQGRAKAHSRLNLDSASVLSPATLMKKYVDFIDTSLNKDRLIKEGERLCGLHD